MGALSGERERSEREDERGEVRRTVSVTRRRRGSRKILNPQHGHTLLGLTRACNEASESFERVAIPLATVQAARTTRARAKVGTASPSASRRLSAHLQLHSLQPCRRDCRNATMVSSSPLDPLSLPPSARS